MYKTLTLKKSNNNFQHYFIKTAPIWSCFFLFNFFYTFESDPNYMKPRQLTLAFLKTVKPHTIFGVGIFYTSLNFNPTYL